MPPKKKAQKVQKDSVVKAAQQSIQQQIQKTKQESPPKTSEPSELLDSDSSSDEDFNPDEQPAAIESSSSEDERHAPVTGAKKQKDKRKRDDHTFDAELTSGDEATIQQRTTKKRKKGEDDDSISGGEGGEGGFIKTRSQRRTEQQEKRPIARIENATVDVDSLWAKLASLPVGRTLEPVEPKPSENEEDYVTIHRTTKFAGQVTTEERKVLKSSQEAKLYLAEQEANKKRQQEQERDAQIERDGALHGEASSDTAALPALRRPLFRKSRFEPNPAGEVKSLPPHLQLTWPRNKMPSGVVTAGADENAPFNPRALPKLAPAAKLNTVQKSKYDWAGYVDKAGIAAELDEYGKSKESYALRTEFLNRAEGRREEERLAAKKKTG